MALQERGMAGSDPQALPDAVPEHEPGVEDRDDGLLTRHELPVDPDEDPLVARVILVVVGAVRHPGKPMAGGYRRRPGMARRAGDGSAAARAAIRDRSGSALAVQPATIVLPTRWPSVHTLGYADAIAADTAWTSRPS